jgi:hypothetical protein
LLLTRENQASASNLLVRRTNSNLLTKSSAMPDKKQPNPNFKGNKSYLPSKPCVVCGREMTWRKAWAKNWHEVKYCSEACRKR